MSIGVSFLSFPLVVPPFYQPPPPVSSPGGVSFATFPRTIRTRNIPPSNLRRRRSRLHLRSRNLPSGNLPPSNLRQRNLPRGNLHLRSSNLRLRREKLSLKVTKKPLFAFRGQVSGTKKTIFEFRGSKKTVFRTTVERNPRRPMRTPHRSAAKRHPLRITRFDSEAISAPDPSDPPRCLCEALREQPREPEGHRVVRGGAHTHGAHPTERGVVKDVTDRGRESTKKHQTGNVPGMPGS